MRLLLELLLVLQFNTAKNSRHWAEWRLFFVRCVSLITIIIVYFPIWNVIRMHPPPFAGMMEQPPCILQPTPGSSRNIFILYDNVSAVNDDSPAEK